MVARITIERLLRDDDDNTGQSVRDWKIEVNAGHVTIRLKFGDGFILLREEDIDGFIADLRRAKETSASLRSEDAS